MAKNKGVRCNILIKLRKRTIDFKALVSVNTRTDDRFRYRFTLFGADGVTAIGHKSLPKMATLKQLNSIYKDRIKRWLNYHGQWESGVQDIVFTPLSSSLLSEEEKAYFFSY